MKIRKLTRDDVTFEIECLNEDMPVRGNCIASDDADYDREAEDEIIERLDRGDTWAWCCVKVTCRVPGTDLEGTDYLGGCSYENEADFLKTGYFEDMCDLALDDLQAQLQKRADTLAPFVEVSTELTVQKVK